MAKRTAPAATVRPIAVAEGETACAARQTMSATSDATQARPDLDAVLVWVTATVENDYIDRSVFPAIRRAKAFSRLSASAVFCLTQPEAEALLEDAQARYACTRRSVKNAFGQFAQAVGKAIEEAKGRRAIFEATEPVCDYKSDYSEDWHGSKEQLLAMGIRLAGPWPGEPGGKERWVKATDSRGYHASISRYCTIWDLYKARIEIPQEVRRQSEAVVEREKKQVRAQANLDAMPNTADEFRRELVKDARRWLAIAISTESAKWHGYSLTDESVTAILMSCDAVVEAIMDAEVNFDAARHQQIALGYKKEIAGADSSFQQALATLTKPNAKILEGRPS
jgi:hypothetical protein